MDKLLLKIRQLCGVCIALVVWCICMGIFVTDAYAAEPSITVGGNKLTIDVYYKDDGTVGTSDDYSYYYTYNTEKYRYDMHLKDAHITGGITFSDYTYIILEGDSTIVGDGTGNGILITYGSLYFYGDGSLTIDNFENGMQTNSYSIYAYEGIVNIKNTTNGIYSEASSPTIRSNGCVINIDAQTCINMIGKYAEVNISDGGEINLTGKEGIKLTGEYSDVYNYGKLNSETTTNKNIKNIFSFIFNLILFNFLLTILYIINYLYY